MLLSMQLLQVCGAISFFSIFLFLLASLVFTSENADDGNIAIIDANKAGAYMRMQTAALN